MFSDPTGFIAHYSDLASGFLKGYAIFNLIQAAREIEITQVTTTLRIRGSLEARNILGLREKVNWVRPENMRLVAQSSFARALEKLKSWGVAVGLGINLANDTNSFLEGEYDRHEYASALTIDSGITIAGALIGGAVAGAVTGALIGGGIGSVTLPVVGTITGAALAGAGGAIVGMIATGLVLSGFENVGIRAFLIEKVADLYRNWTTTGP